MPDIQEIPSPLTINESDNFVFFYLKTTGLSRNSDITQIAAACGSHTFQSYVIPRTEITQEASTITGITFSHSSNKMYVNGTIVETCSVEQSLLDFIDFLKLNDRPILVGHNIANFDMLTLVKEILKSTYSAHNAKEDVLSLKKLFEVKLQEKCINEDVYNLDYNHAKISFKPPIDMKIIKTLISSKLARSGVHLCHLNIANARDGNGVKAILTENHVSAKYAGAIIQFLTVPEE
ncbi:unnamed protein product [Mytilus coruscus]|uniref:DNA-directed DNA polymerase family B exonuclease domain-containing protein n=1 Tax=Mytilus coruscus TaxID=42192 RepID=A0A6J8B4J9_MYTCO|nr:unnamed protein product [Mytilus coruscus]